MKWVPVEKAEAARWKLPVEDFFPSHKPTDFGLVLDQSVWVEMPMVGRWLVAFRLVNQRGQLVIAEVRVFPAEAGKRTAGRWSGEYGGGSVRIPPGGITARLLRTIRTQTFNKMLRTIMMRWEKELGELDLGLIPLVTPPLTNRGRKGRSDATLARIAAAYEEGYLAGTPPVQAVAKAMRLSLTQARDAIHRARVRGLLSPASKQGKVGGRLTPTARALLKQQGKKKRGKYGKKR
jgi:hypothetical protein